MIGRIKWFNDDKGYGFISQEDGPDVFVHFSSITMNGFRSLKADDEVEFELQENPRKGLAALTVRKIEK